MQPSPSPEPPLAVELALAFDGLTPERRDALEVAHRVDPRGLDELRLAPLERVGRSFASRDQHPDRRHRDLALLEGAPRLGHLVQCAGDPNVLAREAPRDLEPAYEPRRGREEPVALVQASTFDLSEPA